jgi:hypothetical protein
VGVSDPPLRGSKEFSPTLRLAKLQYGKNTSASASNIPSFCKLAFGPGIATTSGMGLMGPRAYGDLQIGKASALRRSQRVCLTLGVEVFRHQGDERGAGKQTKTLTVSGHGTLLLLNTPVVIGDSLTLRNLTTKTELRCRVVNQAIGPQGVPEVGIEFVKPSRNFWHIAFPPED